MNDMALRPVNVMSLCSGTGGQMSTCEQCGATVAKDGRGRLKRFCNRSCASLLREVMARLDKEQRCAGCGGRFYRPYGKRRARMRFCSKQCASEALKGKSADAILNEKMAKAACSLLHRALRHKGIRKDARLVDALGYTPKDLRAHLERQFAPGMSWANYGRHGWHIDHERPISTFPKTASIREINSLTNLRPLWEPENCGRRNCG